MSAGLGKCQMNIREEARVLEVRGPDICFWRRNKTHYESCTKPIKDVNNDKHGGNRIDGFGETHMELK